ncbi:hypothetical protein QAD02_014879 [Eretmocerus hayati]|uniref:Uncharacterized protein n=1 Tax=Eretmocerus hayati TaxID=131215 RepID=A0ACC2P9G7_9HYME|nr:hypothetical protein QAD02_014879 [Eretmocerus hayati]
MEKGAEIEVKKIGYVKAVYTDTKEVAILPIDSIHGVKDFIKIKTKLYWTEIEDGADPKKIRKRTLVIINAGKTVEEMIKKEKVNASKRKDTIPPARLIESASDNDDNQKLNSERLAKGSSTNKGLRMKQNIVVNRPDVNELLAKKKEQMHNKSFKQLYPEALATEKGIVPLKQAVVKIPETVKPVSTWKNYDLKNMNLTAYDRAVLEILIDVKKSIDDLTTRIEKIESIQIANTPKFADFIDQMASMKTTNASELTKLQTQYENILNIMNNRNIGRQVYLPESVYDAVECDAKRKKSQYIRSLASAVYGIETLKGSSVHGEKGPKGEVPRPRLDPTKKLAIEDTFVWWLQNRLSYSKEDSEAERDNVDDYLTRLIVDVRKTPQQREAKREYAKKHRDAKKKAKAELQTSKGKGEKSQGKRKADPISRNIRHFGEKQKIPHPLDTDSDEENTITPSVSETRKYKRMHTPPNSSNEDDDVSEAQGNLENFESFTEGDDIEFLSFCSHISTSKASIFRKVDLDGLSDISQSAIDSDEEKNDEEIDNATSTTEDKDPLS